MAFRVVATRLAAQVPGRGVSLGARISRKCFAPAPVVRYLSNPPSPHSLAMDVDGDGIVDCVQTMIREPYQFDNDTLTMLAIEGNPGAIHFE